MTLLNLVLCNIQLRISEGRKVILRAIWPHSARRGWRLWALLMETSLALRLCMYSLMFLFWDRWNRYFLNSFLCWGCFLLLILLSVYDQYIFIVLWATRLIGLLCILFTRFVVRFDLHAFNWRRFDQLLSWSLIFRLRVSKCRIFYRCSSIYLFQFLYVWLR